MIKGVILAGGRGTRLRPFTHVINKHLLPVYDKPLIYYPLLVMRDAGITEILLTSDAAALPSFHKLLEDGSEFGLRISYAAQTGPKGIADALGLAETFAGGSKIAVMLGDNLFTNHEQIKKVIAEFEKGTGARFFLKEVRDPERFGVAQVENAKIISIVEKPKNPRSNLAVTGLYLYDPDVFEIIKNITPSERGELEITDVNNHYVNTGKAGYEIIRGDWIDAGTFDSLTHASNLMRGVSAKKEMGRKKGEKRSRKLAASLFRASSKLLKGSGISRLPLIGSAQKGLLKYFKQRVPSFVVTHGNILFLDEQDRLELSTRGSYESYEREILGDLVRPGDTVLDIGAHVGYHTLALARMVGDQGKVVAFESNPINFALLEKNIEVNQYSNIMPVKSEVAETKSSNTITLDDFIHNQLDGRVDLIKLGVDRGKRLALQGMHSALKKDSLALLMEYDPAAMKRLGRDPKQDFALLRSNGFEIYSLHKSKNEMIKITELEQMIGKNLLCVKGEKKKLLKNILTANR